jgi:4-alpha-glucanotransferase
MKFPRSSGILLHPTSLSGPYGIGDLGDTAYSFIDFLAASGCKLWQVLPLGPTGYGDSPYQCFSAFAGNPLLISLEKLAEEGILPAGDLATAPSFANHEVDYGSVIRSKRPYSERPRELQEGATPSDWNEFHFWRHQTWLDDTPRSQPSKRRMAELFGTNGTLHCFAPAQNHYAVDREAQ